MVKFLKHSVKPLELSLADTVNANFSLKVIQQPVKARVAGRKQTRNSSRRLVDPQPVIEIRLANDDHTNNIIDHSLSMYFVRASIECLGSKDKESFFQKQRKSKLFDKSEVDDDVLRGTTTVTAQFYRGSPYTACVVFDNLSVRYKGSYRLKFDLYEIQSVNNGGSLFPKVVHWGKASAHSSVFTVYTDAAFDGLEASPELNNELKKAGCKIRARKQRNIIGGHALVDINGYRINKNFSYQNGQIQYAFNGTNHFNVDPEVFNRPGTSIDVMMYNNNDNVNNNFSGNNNGFVHANRLMNGVGVRSASTMNFNNSMLSENNNSNNNNNSNVNNSNNNGVQDIKRPQSALPQLITSGEQFDFVSSYSDMLRSALTANGLTPQDRTPKRPFSTMPNEYGSGAMYGQQRAQHQEGSVQEFLSPIGYTSNPHVLSTPIKTSESSTPLNMNSNMPAVLKAMTPISQTPISQVGATGFRYPLNETSESSAQSQEMVVPRTNHIAFDSEIWSSGNFEQDELQNMENMLQYAGGEAQQKFAPEMLNFNDIYQSEMLLQQNFSM